jgi:ABC-type antimicrobial peptide transport system permease subunit
MMFLGTLMFLAGNYVDSMIHAYDRSFEYYDNVVKINVQTTDEDFKDFEAFVEKVKADPKLDYVRYSALGFPSLSHGTVLGIDIYDTCMVFNSVEDAKKVFDHLGIRADLSGCKDRSVILTEDFAKNRGLKPGDVLDKSYNMYLNWDFTVDALVDDPGYAMFYIFDNPENLFRLYIFSDSMQGQELYDYVRNLVGDLKVQVIQPYRAEVLPEMTILYVIFYAMVALVAVVLAVTINSVMSGQYMKRTYEFGVYRALGRSRREIRRKVAKEVLLMNLIAVLMGAAIILLYTYLVNSLIYNEKGLHLLYFSRIGLIGFMLCEVLILVPVILSKGRRMGKADVTGF